MSNRRLTKIIEKTVDFSDVLEFNFEHIGGVYHYTNIVWVRKYPSGERIEVPQKDAVSLVEWSLF